LPPVRFAWLILCWWVNKARRAAIATRFDRDTSALSSLANIQMTYDARLMFRYLNTWHAMRRSLDRKPCHDARMNDGHTTAIASTLAAGFKARPGCAADLVSLSAFFGLTYEDFVAAQVPADQLRAIRKLI
jgi:hypothetical protein